MAMRERQRLIVKLFWRRLLMLGLLTLVVFSLFSVWGVYTKERDSRVLRERAEAELAELQEQQFALSQRIESLRTDRGKEAALRQQYELGKEGETLIVIVEPEASEPVQATSSIRQWVRKFLPFW